MKAEAKFNDSREPVVIVFPETQEEVDVLLTMRGRHRRDDGDHILVMGMFVNEGELECATFTTNYRGHPTTIIPL